MRSSIHLKLIPGFALAFVLAALAVLLTYRTAQERIETGSLLERTLETLRALEGTRAAAADLETGTRGFVITGDEDFLQPYYEARSVMPGQLESLRKLTADNPSQQVRLAALEELLANHLKYRAELVRLVKQRGMEAGRQLVAGGRGKSEMDAIRAALEEMETEQKRLLRLHLEAAGSADRRQTWVLVTLAVLIGTILLGSYLTLRRHLAERLRAEEALRESERNLAVTLNSIGDGVLATDGAGRITCLNPAAERLTGWTSAEAIGRPASQVFQIVDERTRQPAACPVDNVLATGTGVGLADEAVLVARDGSEASVADSAAPIRTRDGRLVGVVLVFRDVTAERSAERALRASEERYRQIAELLPHALFIQCEGRFVFMNSAGLALFGASRPESIVGKSVLDFVHPESRDIVQERIRQINTQRLHAPPLEQRWFRLDGTVFWGEAAANPYTHEGKPGAVVILQDVSRRKRAEEELRALNRQLERQTRAMEEANRELESFSYSVSHDLRAPLRHIQGFVDMLVRDSEDRLSDRSRRYLGVIAAASVEMGQLIDDLLAFSRMGRAEMRETVVDMNAAVRDAIGDLEIVSAGRNIVWTTSRLPLVKADPSMLKQVLANLLGNAVKYTRPRDRAEIEIACSGFDGSHAVFFVRDNGVGFDMKYAHKLFGVFQRLHRSEDFEGTGIGLATVRRIIARLGGRTWAESAVNQGAKFYFTLPLAAPD